jgi:sugar phosphate isomerase/epimerase
VCAWLPGAYQSDLDGFSQAADKVNRWGALAQKRGMRLAFHNHNYEFALHDGRTGFDVLMERTDPKLVGLEFDCYWLAQAGRDPVAMIDKHRDRVRLLHLKDRPAGQPTSQRVDSEGQAFLDVGAGALDWPAILAKANDVGVEHLFVERDKGEMPALESLRASFGYLQSRV